MDLPTTFRSNGSASCHLPTQEKCSSPAKSLPTPSPHALRLGAARHLRGQCVFMSRFHLAMRIWARHVLSLSLGLLICNNGGGERNRDRESRQSILLNLTHAQLLWLLMSQPGLWPPNWELALRTPRPPFTLPPWLLFTPSSSSLQLHPRPVGSLPQSHCLE